MIDYTVWKETVWNMDEKYEIGSKWSGFYVKITIKQDGSNILKDLTG